MGVDGEPLVGEYDSSHGTPQASAAAALPGPPAPMRLRQRHRPNRGVALLVVVLAVAGLVTYHLVASGPAGGAPAAARAPVAGGPKTARARPAAANTRAPPAARHGPREVVISLTAVTGACWADLATPAGATIFAGILGPGTAPRRGHPDRGRQQPRRARVTAGHAQTGTRHEKSPVTHRRGGRLRSALPGAGR